MIIIGNAELHHGDCIEKLRGMADNCMDSIVTDPPYELGFMGKAWDATGIANNPGMWAECLRVLKPGGHLLAFSGSRTYHRMTCAIEDAGFDVRDQIMWVYGSGFPKSHNLAGEHEGWGTALKPAHEPICVARKPLIGTVAANVLAHGTGAINIDGCRVATGESQSRPRGSFPHSDDAWGDGRPNEVSESHASGRWPANLIHDGSEEVLALFPANAGAAAPVRGTEASAASTGNVTGKRERVEGVFHADKGSAARFFYCAKASKSDRGEGNNHPTVKPTALMQYLCRLVTPPGGVVLDPFMGSGSTGKAAIAEGFRFVGIDLSPEYVAIAAARIAHAQSEAAVPVQMELVA
jgi:DNA modification methylase